MRTLQEKYNAVLEGNYSKAEFLRDAKTSQPQFITQYNSYDDAIQILKNKGMIAEAKVQEPKYSTAKPEDTIAPDVLDTGIKFELDKKYGTLDVTDEQYAKCREMAIKNLANDVLYYVKQDSIQLETPGEKMEKAKLNEGIIDKIKKGYNDYQINRMVKRSKKNALPAKTPEVLSTTEIDNKIKEIGIENVLNKANIGEYSLENATEQQVLQFLPVVAKIDNFDHGREYMIANALKPIKAYQKFADKFERGVVKNTFNPDLVDPVVKAEPNQTLKEISKEDAWKEYQEKRHVTSQTIKAAEEDFKTGWEEGKFRDGNYMSEETGPTGIALSQKQMDQLHDKGAVMVQVTVKDSDGSIRTVDYPLSYLGYEKDIDDTEDSSLEEQAVEPTEGVTLIKDRTGNPYTGESFNGKAFVAYVKNNQANALPARGSEDGGHENLQAALDSLTGSRILIKYSESGKYEPTDAAMEVYIVPKAEAEKLFPGLDFTPKEGPSHSIDLKEEQQLKELFKKIITKIITE